MLKYIYIAVSVVVLAHDLEDIKEKEFSNVIDTLQS